VSVDGQFDLSGKVAIVTGGGGVGRRMAQGLVEAGAEDGGESA
jgi:NAD(P)-dependent dehydrogenase (short-subunit alcohol dehydrogenase family)